MYARCVPLTDKNTKILSLNLFKGIQRPENLEQYEGFGTCSKGVRL